MAEKYFYFVDSDKYEVDGSSINVADIKAKIPNFDHSYALFLEGKGQEEDVLVQDNQSFDLSKKGTGPLKFYTAPPATFG